MDAISIHKADVEIPEKPSGIVLYHGTSSAYGTDIKSAGLLPRRMTGNSNFDDEGIPSDPELVYLGDRYHFAHGLSTVAKVPGNVLLVRVRLDDLDFANVFPDEDAIFTFLEQKNYHGFGNRTNAEKLRRSRTSIRTNQALWYEFFKCGGTVGHQGVIDPRLLEYSEFPALGILKQIYLRKDRRGRPLGIVQGANALPSTFHASMAQWAFGADPKQIFLDQIRAVLNKLDVSKRDTRRLMDEFVQLKPRVCLAQIQG
jgi:hypothetical protein